LSFSKIFNQPVKSVETFLRPGAGALKSYFAPEHFLIDQAGFHHHQRSAIGRLRPLRLKRNDLRFALGRREKMARCVESAADGEYLS
jgi:hypothetical protein